MPPPGDSEAVARVICPGCGARFRVRRREGRSDELDLSATSGILPRRPEAEPPPEPTEPEPEATTPVAEPAVVGDAGLRLRGLALTGLRGAYHLGTAAGATVLLAGGGFVPVARRWLADELPGGWGGVVEALGGVRVGVASADPDADFGPVLSRNDAPRLLAEVAELARKLGARPPKQVRLTFLPCCGAVGWGRGSKALLLGLPLVQVLSLAELRAVLAHELAHLARGDANATARSARFVEALGRALDRAPASRLNPLRAWATGCRRLGDRLVAPIARSQEVRADRASAALAGGDAAASALVKVALVQPLFRQVLDRYDPERDDLPNLYAFFRDFWARLPAPLTTAMRHGLLADRRAPVDPAHPPLLDRLAVVQAYPPRGGPEAVATPASALFADLDAIERGLHDHLFATMRRVEPTVFHRAGS